MIVLEWIITIGCAWALACILIALVVVAAHRPRRACNMEWRNPFGHWVCVRSHHHGRHKMRRI